ncbi:alpha/beta hydrolase [Dyadobacter sp. CY323]|uniref:alpha/beta hydrolase n=1 Tax=Dyadobacter sp. CY323 TaxID=2907302 RepID=UPI001F1F35E5|nr:alpha/beta hydrolase [Dyadobacter sp. CY323]MCE6991034.1 alpha/beta hydrolase [Dyadobacter sp. CY323]
MKRTLTAILILIALWPVVAQTCETGILDARVAESLKTFLSDLPAAPTVSVEAIKERKITPPAFPATDVKKLRVSSDSVSIQIYNPGHQTGLPIIISFHPGGFITPMLSFMEYECWRQAKVYNALVIAVDYRIAPEHPFPAAVNDAFNAFKWASEHGHEYGGDTSRIIVLGLSAGGNLAAVVCQKAKDAGLVGKIKLQILNCPSTDNPRNADQYPSYQRYASGYFLTKKFCQYYMQLYAPDVDIRNPDVAPIQREDLHGLPPAVIITAEFDPLRDEGFAYSNRLQKAGVTVHYRCFPGQIHNLLGLLPEADELQQADNIVIGAMKKI